MKTCCRCGQSKAISDFYASNQTKDGRRPDCKPCFKAMRDRSVAKIRDIPKPDVDGNLVKTCSKCGQAKPLSEYFRHKDTRDGLRPDCKACLMAVQKVRYRRDKPKIQAWQRKHAKQNAEAIRRTQQENHRRRSQNPEWLDRTRAKAREYGRTHREQRADRQRRRVARLANAPVNDFTLAQWQAIKAAYGNRCAYCGIESRRLCMEHVIPLSKHGSHTARNIVPSCGPCNARKGSGPPLPFHVIPTSLET